MEKIHFIITGGTIDSHWDPIVDRGIDSVRTV